MRRVYIKGCGSVSPLGATPEAVAHAYRSGRSRIRPLEIGGAVVPAAPLASDAQQLVEEVQRSRAEFAPLDRTVHLAVAAARLAHAHCSAEVRECGVVIGSSRGATGLFERHHRAFLETSKVSPLTSPVTTLGNLSSWVAQDLMLDGFVSSHSVTCSSSLHALVTAVAWIRASMADRFLAGGAEAPLTSFTLAQMEALRIYSHHPADDYPCRPLAREVVPTTGLVLGEGAVMFSLDTEPRGALAEIVGIGVAVEHIPSATGISEEGAGLERSMQRAIAQIGSRPIDCIVMHAPGTRKGDLAELSAIRRVFPDSLPALVSTKWIFGHTFAAAGAFNLEYGLQLLRGEKPLEFPYPAMVSRASESAAREIRTVMVNAAGFGGNSVSIVIGV